MSRTSKITRAKLLAAPSQSEMLREMDLVIAANTLESLNTGSILYNNELNARVAEFCAPSDRTLNLRYLGIFPVLGNSNRPWEDIAEATEFLAPLKRGNWAKFERNGGFDAYMSDGYGGVTGLTNGNFTYSRPSAPDLNAMNLYSSVLSSLIDDRRRTIEEAIIAETYSTNPVKVGTVVQNVWLSAKTYNKAEFVGIREATEGQPSTPIPIVRATRRGVKPVLLNLTLKRFNALFGLPNVMPAEFRDAGKVERLATLGERRIVVANILLDRYLEENPIANLSPFARPGYWRFDGAEGSCNIMLDEDGTIVPAGKFIVTFEIGYEQAIGSRIVWTREPEIPVAPRR